MVETPDGHGRLELVKFHFHSVRSGDGHAPANTLGLRHVAFAVDDMDAAVSTVRARGGELVGEVELRRHLPALLRPRTGGDHHRAGGADWLRAPERAARGDEAHHVALREEVTRDPGVSSC
jgi:hypothetical protein